MCPNCIDETRRMMLRRIARRERIESAQAWLPSVLSTITILLLLLS